MTIRAGRLFAHRRGLLLSVGFFRQFPHVRGEGGGDAELGAAARHPQFRGVERLARKKQTRTVGVGQLVFDEFREKGVIQPVKLVAGHRIAERTECGTDLVQPSRARKNFHFAESIPATEKTEGGLRAFSAGNLFKGETAFLADR